MSANDIILIVVSSLGVIHGVFLSAFLWIYKKGNTLSNRLLALLLIILSFRIGKSVFLEFLENLDVKVIFIGLASLMAIGPLFFFFTQSYVHKKLPNGIIRNLTHFIPFVLGIGFGFWLSEADMETTPLWVFALIFMSYYLHFLAYLILSRNYALRNRSNLKQETLKLLGLLFYALLAIWVVYVLNLFDETVPYIIGPILYSVIAYTISFEIIRKGYLENADYIKYRTTAATEEQVQQIFEKVNQLLINDEYYKNPEITLKSLSESLKVSTQLLSMSINQTSGKNFNNFINSFRVLEATHLFENKEYNKLTVAAVAYEVGFNSISSFNTAFKKQTGQTPQEYRSKYIK